MPRRRSEERWRDYGDRPLHMILRIVIVIVIVGVLLQIFFSFSDSVFYTPMYYHYGWVWGVIAVIFFLWFISWAFSWPWRYRYHGFWRFEDPEEILRMRYANGEISESQYIRMLRNLRRHY